MKYIFIVLVGFLCGFMLLGGVAKRAVIAVSIANTSSGILRARAARGAPIGGSPATSPTMDGVPATPDDARALAATEIVPVGKPARTRPQAFDFSGYARMPYEASRVSPEIAASPEFKELSRKVLTANLEDRLVPMTEGLGMTQEQVGRLVAAVADAIERNPLPEPDADKSAYQERSDAISRDTEAALSGFLTDDQLEGLAGSFAGYSPATTVEDFADRGMPISLDQLTTMIKSVPVQLRGESYLRHSVVLDPAAPGLTPAQRNYLVMKRDWADRSWLAQSLQTAEVRDPDLFDIWPW